jgi:hypothetical protein
MSRACLVAIASRWRRGGSGGSGYNAPKSVEREVKGMGEKPTEDDEEARNKMWMANNFREAAPAGGSGDEAGRTVNWTGVPDEGAERAMGGGGKDATPAEATNLHSSKSN